MDNSGILISMRPGDVVQVWTREVEEPYATACFMYRGGGSVGVMNFLFDPSTGVGSIGRFKETDILRIERLMCAEAALRRWSAGNIGDLRYGDEVRFFGNRGKLIAAMDDVAALQRQDGLIIVGEMRRFVTIGRLEE